MPKYKDNNNHSEEAQEILGRIPSWTTRWGITVIFSSFIAIILVCCFIRYPERVTGIVTITTANAPVDVVVKSSGNLELLSVSSGDFVEEGEILGVIHTGANYRDVMAADSCLLSFVRNSTKEAVFNGRIYNSFLMGDLQTEWTSFVSSCQRYRDYLTRSVMAKKRKLIGVRLDKQKEQYLQMRKGVAIMEEDLRYEEKSFARDSSLFQQNAVSEQEYEESVRRLLQTRNSLISFKSQMTATELSVIQLEQQLVDLSIQEEDETLTFENDIRTNLEQLCARIRSWKLDYILTAPIKGKVSFVHKWDKGQFVNAGEYFLTVVPEGIQSVLGIVKVPQQSLGKVSAGQKVNVKLEGYPYMEYGMLVGTIGYLSSVPAEQQDPQRAPQYMAEIMFENGMKTTYGKDLNLIQRMDGTAELITEERSLIMRILDPLVALFKNGI